jgi:hypothetical protein
VADVAKGQGVVSGQRQVAQHGEPERGRKAADRQLGQMVDDVAVVVLVQFSPQHPQSDAEEEDAKQGAEPPAESRPHIRTDHVSSLASVETPREPLWRRA